MATLPRWTNVRRYTLAYLAIFTIYSLMRYLLHDWGWSGGFCTGLAMMLFWGITQDWRLDR